MVEIINIAPAACWEPCWKRDGQLCRGCRGQQRAGAGHNTASVAYGGAGPASAVG